MARAKLDTPVIYAVAFSEVLAKVGLTRNWPNRRKSLTHSGGLSLIGETLFIIDQEERLEDVEALVLDEVRQRFPRAAGKEYFKAPHTDLVHVVSSALIGAKVEHQIAEPDDAADRAVDLSEMTGDQLDAAIRRFCVNHGVPATRVVRWLGAARHARTIRDTGFVPAELAQSIERLWERPALLFQPSRGAS